MILQDIRNALRNQLDLPDEEDLSTALIDSFIVEGYNEIIGRQQQWPFFETQWTVDTTADGAPVDLPSDLGAIDTIRRTSDGAVLTHVNFDDAEDQFQDSTGTPFLYSLWGGQIWFWPAADAVDTYTIRGWRQGDEAWVQSAANEPDTGNDRRLDRAMVHYACYRAFQQQEDPELADLYYQAFERHIYTAISAIMRPRYNGKIIVGQGVPVRSGGRSFYWDVS